LTPNLPSIYPMFLLHPRPQIVAQNLALFASIVAGVLYA
jgi:hypothetical protein